MISQFIQIIDSMIMVIINAFFSLFPFIKQISGLKNQMIATAFGIPVFVITLCGLLFIIIKFIWRSIKYV